MRKNLTGTALAIMLGTLSILPDCLAKGGLLRGFDQIGLKVRVGKDVEHQLHEIGAWKTSLPAELRASVGDKIQAAGIKIREPDLDAYPTLYLDVDSDITINEVRVAVRLREPVSPVRSPGTKIVVTTWSDTANPADDTPESIRKSAMLLVDEFVGDYIEDNPRTERADPGH